MMWFFFIKIWVQSPHNASGYFTIYGDDSSYQDHFNARLVTGGTGEVYARTGYLGFLRRTEAIGSDGGKETKIFFFQFFREIVRVYLEILFLFRLSRCCICCWIFRRNINFTWNEISSNWRWKFSDEISQKDSWMVNRNLSITKKFRSKNLVKSNT